MYITVTFGNICYRNTEDKKPFNFNGLDTIC